MNISGMVPDYGNTATAAAKITAAATFHCDYRGEDPNLGIASPFWFVIFSVISSSSRLSPGSTSQSFYVA